MPVTGAGGRPVPARLMDVVGPVAPETFLGVPDHVVDERGALR